MNVCPFATAAAVMLLTCGCGGQLVATAASDLQCAPESISHEQVTFGVERVSGCGKDGVYMRDNYDGRWFSPMEQASFDLSCPREQLKWTLLGEGNVGVTGCEKKARYIFVRRTGWVLNATADGGAPTDREAPKSP